VVFTKNFVKLNFSFSSLLFILISWWFLGVVGNCRRQQKKLPPALHS
jgi:hypothetical protein